MNTQHSQKYESGIFAGGCFWGVEYYMKNLPGVVSATVGYTGGQLANPTYKQVCNGNTGHVEAIKVVYDPKITNYTTVAREFFEIHDPTQQGRQGPDIGPQYESVVFYQTQEQKQIAQELIDQLKRNGLRVVTRIEPAAEFFPAEDYHQDYYGKNGHQPYCHKKESRF